MMGKLPYDEWNDELTGKKEHSSWWLVLIAIPFALGAVFFLRFI